MHSKSAISANMTKKIFYADSKYFDTGSKKGSKNVLSKSH
jgi:hypothetical protein